MLRRANARGHGMMRRGSTDVPPKCSVPPLAPRSPKLRTANLLPNSDAFIPESGWSSRQLLESPARSSSASHRDRRLYLIGSAQTATAARLPSSGASCVQGIWSFTKRITTIITHRMSRGRRAPADTAWATRDQDVVTDSSLMTFGQRIIEAGASLRAPVRDPPERGCTGTRMHGDIA